MAGEKTEQATPKRKQDERKKGNVFQSRELVVVFSLLATFYALKYMGPMIVSALQKSLRDYMDLSASVQTLTASDVQNLFINGCLTFAVAALPLLLISSLVAVALTMAQTKGLFSAKAMAPKFNRINPLQGIKRMFSLRGVIELVKSLIKIVVLAYIIYDLLKKQLGQLPRLMDMTILQAATFVGDMILEIVKYAAIIMVFVAIFDYLYQWWEYERNLRMSKQEVKEEYKQTEGDPQVKGKIKERQQQQARRRMMQQVPNADVVIRNPTHYAVAIRYDPEKNRAPLVVAKGADRVALRIVAIAEENDVVVMENRPLARGLFETVDLDMEIPEKFYQPVAEVLAFVYSLKEKAPRGLEEKGLK